MQVIAVSCQGNISSTPTTKKINILPIAVEISLTVTWSFSKLDIESSPKLRQQLVDGVADALGISSFLVQLVAYKDARRRLLALSITFRVLASSADTAASLKQKATTADFQGAMESRGVSLLVSGVHAVLSSGEQIAQTTPIPDASYIPSTMIIAIAASAGSVVVVVGLFLGCFACRKNAKVAVQGENAHNTGQHLNTSNQDSGNLLPSDCSAQNVGHIQVCDVLFFVF